MRHKIKLSKAAAQMVVAEWLTRDILSRAEPNEFNDPAPEIAMTSDRLTQGSKRLRLAALCVAVTVFLVLPCVMICAGCDTHQDTVGEQEGDMASVVEVRHADIREELDAAFGIPDGSVGATALELREQWASNFARTKAVMDRERKRLGTWQCEGCKYRPGVDGPGQLDHHHLVSVERIAREQLPVELIWDEVNLAIACRRKGSDGREFGCHWVICHRVAGKSNWATSNTYARDDLAARQKRNR
ncbi:hypothetical protein UFOVP466_71 [uncultured Caudovirales phage]|uniref:Uncharacterized protein n=1 Tax=uncultured Caudovirales phage TaxID=2100421 RepID=A0A6J5QL18_9CAUD|nr:hypothetical protein UFOVP466_71 [uncultured Caudovirales phage]CAB4180344.1 hypothetical protein UFOVP1045_18 [uncultured Caudovirales phage]CAB4190563.1 hypothetical protein UFOVP1194_72 [uncultured Caudovirales phage]CAB4221831.1 hypothetical protein UFOVP1641_68 [uncultured Caudovirales phage]